MNRLVNTAAAVSAAALLGVSTASAASASDWGGYADPNSAACGSNYVVGPIVTLKDSKGNVGGYAAVKWSNGCPGNFGRVWTSGGWTRKINATVKDMAHPTIQAGTDESGVDTAWTRVIKLPNANDRVCVYADIYKGTFNTHFSGVACAG